MCVAEDLFLLLWSRCATHEHKPAFAFRSCGACASEAFCRCLLDPWLLWGCFCPLAAPLKVHRLNADWACAPALGTLGCLALSLVHPCARLPKAITA
jgi:hypothetical protein